MMEVLVFKASIFEPKATGFVEQENTSLFFHVLSYFQGDFGIDYCVDINRVKHCTNFAGDLGNIIPKVFSARPRRPRSSVAAQWICGLSFNIKECHACRIP